MNRPGPGPDSRMPYGRASLSRPGRGPRLTRQSRRTFLQQLAAVSAAAGTGLLASCTDSQSSSAGSTTTQQPGPMAGTLGADHVPGRVLVVIDLEGGNDGASMVVPAGSSAYYDLRPTLAIKDGDVLDLDGRLGLNPRLGKLHERGVTVVEGVGATNIDLSHFEMSARWDHGDVAGSGSLRTGFGGRLSDVLSTGSPVTGVSLSGSSPFLLGATSAALSLYETSDLWTLRPSDWEELQAFQQAVGNFGPGLVGTSFDQLLDLGQRLRNLAEDDELDWDDPMLSDGGELGSQLWLAGELIAADVGTRVFYAQLGDFDTHDGHDWRHDELMAQLDAAVGGFLDRADEGGYGDRVVVATISEFGRRAEENEGGLDHGSASTMLIAGAIEPQVLGEPSDFSDLDEDGNLRVTTTFDQYLASLAQDWLGIEASSVLPNNPDVLNLL